MKKLLLALVAVTMTASAFADGHNMIRLDGCADNGRCDNLDFRTSSDDLDEANASQTIAFNYARSFGMWGAGLTYMSSTRTTDGDKADPSYTFDGTPDNMNKIVLSGYYNIDGQWSDSCFIGFHYGMGTVEDGDTTDDSGWKTTEITLEYGHRYALGKAMMGVTVNWSPSVSYAMATASPNNDDADDISVTDLRLNVANFAATF